MSAAGHAVITGGAGYIGSLLCGLLLQRGTRVTVIDDLLFDGGPILPYLSHPNFQFVKGNVLDPDVLDAVLPPANSPDPPSISTVIHLAAIVGFPACQAVGREVAWRYNVEATQRVFDAAERAGAERFLMASTYSNYGLAEDERPVTEDSPLHPQSLYAETKIAAEQFLTDRSKSSHCTPIIYRFSTLFGISPRTRFDLIVNQFVLEALTKRKLIIYQRGTRAPSSTCVTSATPSAWHSTPRSRACATRCSTWARTRGTIRRTRSWSWCGSTWPTHGSSTRT